MTQHAASEQKLGKLHDKLADVLSKVIDGYIKRLEALDRITVEDLEEDMLAELFDDAKQPNPAMLTVVSNFLKNNDVRFDSGVVSKLGELNEQLEERRKRRGNIAQLSIVPQIDEAV